MSLSSQHVAGPVVSRTVVDRRPISLFVGLFVLGALAGVVELLTDSDQTSTGARVAVANWIHIGLAVALIVALLVAYRRNRRWLVTFLVRPFRPRAGPRFGEG